ncbi:MAG: hypothetical protein WA775_02890 [Psychroserpens sp.]|uniref:hypothetical protein n=1 Tax=Psychroserpens sp. TaxID=2020870 RepID=UPI003CB9C8C2
MKKQKVIPTKYIPAKFPLTSTLVHVIALSYWNAPSWLWGSWAVLIIIVWIAVIYRITIEERDDSLVNEGCFESEKRSFKDLVEKQGRK